MRLAPRRVDERDALGDEPARARAQRRINQVARSLDPHARVAYQSLGHQLRLEPVRQVGELMDDDVGPRRQHRGAERGRVEDVDYGRCDSGSAQLRGPGCDARGAGHFVSGLAQQRQHPPPYRTGRSRQENFFHHLWLRAFACYSAR